MKTDNQNPGNINQVKNTGNQQQINQSQNKDKNASEKKGTYIKDMPPIDVQRPGVI